jgi:hypothetical protein
MQENFFKKELNKLRKNHVILAALILLLVCVVVWTGVSLASSQQKTQITPKLLKQSQPLTPTLNQSALEGLELKRSYSDEELADFPIYLLTSSEDGRQEVVTTLKAMRQARLVVVESPTVPSQSEFTDNPIEPAGIPTGIPAGESTNTVPTTPTIPPQNEPTPDNQNELAPGDSSPAIQEKSDV